MDSDLKSSDALPEPWGVYLEGWRRLTEAEFRAISTSNWIALQQSQHAKSNLREEFEQVLDRVGANPSTATIPPLVRQSVERLIQAEQRNALELSRVMDQVRRSLEHSDSARRSLKQVRQAYTSFQPARVHWQNYS